MKVAARGRISPEEIQDFLALDTAHVWHPYTPAESGDPPLFVQHAEGPYFWTADGRRFIDGNSSWWVAALGHRHPRVLHALQVQMQSLTHIALGGLTHEPAILLAKELVEIAPTADGPSENKLTKVFYSDDGSTSVEVALKLAVQYWAQNGRPERGTFIALREAFHGETVGATSVGGIAAFRQVYQRMLFAVEYVQTPSSNSAEDISAAVDSLRKLLRTKQSQIAGVIVEPMVLGAAGMKMYSPVFLQAIRELCTEFDTFLIADEVFTGLGRTGRMWACEHASVVPDILCTAKALSGAMFPFAATLASQRVFDGFRGGRERAFLYGHSYCGNALGCVVARAVLQTLREENVLAAIAAKSAKILHAMNQIANGASDMAPRALGMIGALELGHTGYHSGRGWMVYREALARGVYARPLGDTVYVVPPLNIQDSVLDELLTALAGAVQAALRA